ncbi:pikAI [Symbiodinium natans]|uniref:PikAI protein n=1 Tax=Symbiodinium natans TaxID=878477 RepID=A0A812R286_9DINO|nr:pikAI [Symbiodinium natans]
MHSHLLSSILPGLEQELQASSFSCPDEDIAFVSCLTGAHETNEVAQPAYWLSHDTARPVEFIRAMKALADSSCNSYIEIGPHPVLLRLGQSCLGQSAGEVTWLPSLEADRSETECMLSALRSLQESFTPPQLQLTRVPWVRPWLHPLLGSTHLENGLQAFRSRTALWDDSSTTATPVIRLFRQHRVGGQVVLPAASHLLLMSCATMVAQHPDKVDSFAPETFVELSDTVFESAFVLSDSRQTQAEVQILPSGIRLSSRGTDASQAAQAVHAQSSNASIVGGPGARGAMLQHSLVEWKSHCPSFQTSADAYRTLEQCGLEYGPSFRAISSFSVSHDGLRVLGRLALKLETWDRSLNMHPGILDGAIQLLLLACPNFQQCFLPFSIDSCIIATTFPSWDLWVTVRVRSASAEAVSGDLEVSTDDGVLVARLSRLTCRAHRPESAQLSQFSQMTYHVAFVEMANRPSYALPQSVQRALVCCSKKYQERVLAALSWTAERCKFVEDAPSALSLLGSGDFGYIAFLAEEEPLEALCTALQVLQTAAKFNTTVVLVAQGTQPPELDQNSFDPTHAGLWGLARSARLEMPELSITCLDLPPDGTHTAPVTAPVAPPLAPPLSPTSWQEQDPCFREKAAYAARLQRSSLSPRWPVQLSLPSRGTFSSLVPVAQQSKLGCFRIAAVGLNFRDVLNVLDLYPGDPGDPGLDCSGILVDPQESIPSGTKLFGISFGCLRTFATVKEPRLLAQRPPRWSHAEAAALPTVFTTVDMAFGKLADLQAGQRVLIHAGAGGVGLTAVQYALRLGAVVYTTAGKEDKQRHLRQMGVKCVTSSRDGRKFEEELAAVLAEENDAKLDVILNSLSHDNFIGRSLSFLGTGGFFIEIGKRGIWTHEEMANSRPDVHYRTLAMDTICEEAPGQFQELMQRLSARMVSGAWDPIPCRVFEGLEACPEALQILRKADHIGKIVVTLPSPLQIREGASYLVTGGTGALGLALSRALLEEGADDLVLLSRNGNATSTMPPWLERSAARVSCWQCDLGAQGSQAHDVLQKDVDSLTALAGVFHLSGILKDGLLAHLQRQDIDATFGPKVRGLQAIQKVLTRSGRWQHLDFLLAFSSTAAILGSAGQANYAAANAAMDAQIHQLRLSGWKAFSLQWGAWLNMGMAQPRSLRHLCQRGIPVDVGLAVMASAMDLAIGPQSESAVSCANVDWEAFLRPLQAQQYFKSVRPDHSESRRADVSPDGDASHRIKGVPAPYENALDWVLAVLADLIGEELDPEDPLTAAGLDSLSAVEFRRKLSTDSGIPLPQTLAFDYPTAHQVAAFITCQGSVRGTQGTEDAERPELRKKVCVQGNACRIPGLEADSISSTAFEAWHIFCKQVDAVTEVPLRRFDINECFDANMSGADFVTYARHASIVEGTDLFDHRMFGISGNEAAAIDPQQRNTLEVAYAACHNAGRLRKSLAKAAIGVFVGQCANDWAKTTRERRAGTFMGPGTHASIAANRLSFCLGLEGVSATIDTACSSTLVALEISILQLRMGLEAVICSGSQLNLIAEPFVAFSNGRLLSASGRCRTFDASADGFARGEGFGSFFVVQAEDDRGPAVLGSMANQDGRSSSLTAPNGPAQQRVINAALGLSGLKGADVSAVECHGTGTALGDPIEVGGLRGTLGDDRLQNLFLMAGKSNVGHLEGGAGALGLQKCLAVVTQLQVPPNLHLASLNPHIELRDFQAQVSTTLETFSAATSSMNVGLSSFGFGGTNAHALLQTSRPQPREPSEVPPLSLRRVPFPWAPPVPRLLGLKRREGNSQVFEVQVDAELAALCQHAVHGQSFISSSLFVAFAMEACRRHAKQAVQLKNVHVVAPLLLPSDGQTWLRLTLVEQQFQVLSKPRQSNEAWAVHCTGRYATQTQATSRPLATSLGGTFSILGSAAARQRQSAARGSETFEAMCKNAELVADTALEELRASATAEGISLGAMAAMDHLSDVHVKRGELCARLRLPADSSQMFAVHPALLQAIQCAVMGLCRFNEVHVERLSQDLASIVSCSAPSVDIPPGTQHLILHMRHRGVASSRSPVTATVSLDGGPTVLDMQDVQFRPVSKKQVEAAASMRQTQLDVPSIFELQWITATSQGRGPLAAAVSRCVQCMFALAKDTGLDAASSASERVLLITGECYRVLELQPGDFKGTSELDWIQQIQVKSGQEASSLLDAVACLASKQASCPVVFLDENAKEDWSWAAPLSSPIVCLGVHEDFEEETMLIRSAVSPTHAAQLGPVALHSSACLHILSSVRLGDAGAPFEPVRPTVVQKDSAPRAVSARSFRRALPRRQPVRFFLRLDDSPRLSSGSTNAQVHQAIVAACLVSKSVYDDRDTRLCLVWPSCDSGKCDRCVTVDRSLMNLSKGRLVPAEGPILDALKLKLETDEKSLEQCMDDMAAESLQLSLGKTAAVRVSEGEQSSWPEWTVQASWPTDPLIMMFLNWHGDLPIPETASIRVPAGSPAKMIATLQHWHNLGVLAALTPRPTLASRDDEELLQDIGQLDPQPGQDVHLGTIVPFCGAVVGRVRMGHVLFADCGRFKVMCKEQRLGASFHVIVRELHVGDILYCRGYPGYEYQGDAAIFATEILAIEPAQGLNSQESVLFQDDSILIVDKPAGKLAWEDNRHRHERGTALRVEAEHLLLAPEAEVSGPAVYSTRADHDPSCIHCRREYFVLVAGRPVEFSCSAALRPARGKPKQFAATQLETLWEGPDCTLLRASVHGPETKSQVCRHLHLLGFPVWGDRRFGSQRANLRSRAVFGLAKPWCHLGRLELFGTFGGVRVESVPPPDLLRVLRAVGGEWDFVSSVQRLPPVMVLSHQENGVAALSAVEDLARFAKIFVVASGTGTARAVEVLQAAVDVLKEASKLAPAPEIWFVMAGTQAAQAEDLAKSDVPFHAGLWGLARCARREQLVMVGCIDVDSTSARAILSRLRAARCQQEDDAELAPETELLVRRLTLDAEESDSNDESDFERYVARLEQTSSEAWGTWPPPTLPSGGWFVISGGCSGLGLASAAWLATQGVSHLALLSRTGRCKDDAQLQTLEKMCEACDLRVILRPCNIAVKKEVEDTLAGLQECDTASVKGILHAAGVLEDHTIAHLETGHMLPVISPKMDGAVNLHESSKHVEHFVLYSSVAALLGSPGQGNYAAANSFLDSFALFRHAKGLPALSVQWGPWADVGMAARSGVGGPGFWAPKISPDNALQALSAVIATSGRGPAALGITRINWSVLLKRMSAMPPAWADWKSHWERPDTTRADLVSQAVRQLRTGADQGQTQQTRACRPLATSVGDGIPIGLGLSFGTLGAGARFPLPERRPLARGGESSGSEESTDSESDQCAGARGL